MTILKILAGSVALQHLRERGLAADHISAVFGASGAAKWLTIYGLDKAVFTRFLNRSTQPVSLFGTSIGAFKLAAAAQTDPAAALTRLAVAYIAQRYQGKVTPAMVANESEKITGQMLGHDGVAQILGNPRFHFHCGTVRCLGTLASPGTLAQRIGMSKAFVLAAIGRSRMRGIVHRAIFSDERALGEYSGVDGFPTDQHRLDRGNFHQAILASGSIPLVMQGVTGLPGEGVYRDGGLLDYHPVPSNLCHDTDRLVLYPHFYPYLIEGWFDKFFGQRRVAGERLKNVILIAPSDEYVASLPGGQIPDRKDFYTFANDDDERQRRWREAMTKGETLGDAFVELVDGGGIADVARPI